MPFFRETCLAAVVFVAGCGLNPPKTDKLATPQKIATDIGIPVAAVGTFYRCDVAQADPSKNFAYFVHCLYVPLSDGAALIGYDLNQNRYALLLRLDATTVQRLALKVMGQAKQFQLHTEQYGFVVFDLLSDDRVWTHSTATAAAYQHLRSLNIPESDPIRLVQKYREVNFQWTYR